MYIQKLRIENVKGFPEVSFNFQRPDGSYAGWTAFVGGNSSGKSTLLKAMALAIVGPEAGGRLMGGTAGWIRKDETKASSVVTMTRDEHDDFKTGGRPPVGVFEAGVRWFIEKKGDAVPQFRGLEKRNKLGTRIQTADRGPWSPNAKGWFGAGYGPMRRLTGSSSESMRFTVTKESLSRFVTLFREDAALSESEEWLRRMHSRSLEENGGEVVQLLEGVKRLLGDGLLPQGMKVSRITVDHVYVQDVQGMELPMRDISDGCRSIYATVLDLVHSLYEVYGADTLFGNGVNGSPVVTRPGVVIIDEIEAHLHPAWQRDIPEWLKKHFPRIQFLVSTHSPLIAQAADPNGLFLLRVQDDASTEPRPATEAEYEKIRWGTAHKTVLGVAFGLDTTRTSWATQRLRRWQELNAKKKAGLELTANEKREVREIFPQLELAFAGAPSPGLADGIEPDLARRSNDSHGIYGDSPIS